MQNVIHIPVTDIRVVNNTRRTENKDSMKELADSIRENGLLQPITVMKQDDSYRLIFGHRRFSAIQSLGWEEMPCITTVLTEEEIISAQLVENIQREDVSPIDEQSSFQELVNAKWTAKQISDNIGKSISYVRGRLNLNLLIPEIKLLVNDGIATVSHAFEFVKLTEVDQKRLLSTVSIKDNKKDIIGLEPVKELKYKIENTIRIQLANSPFSMDDTELGNNNTPCKVCPKRSGANKSLFPDVDQDDLCFDPKCYHEKVNSFIQRVKKGKETEGIEVVLTTEKWLSNKDTKESGNEFHYNQKIMPDDINEHLFPVKRVAIPVDSYDATKIGKALPVFTDQQYAEYEKINQDNLGADSEKIKEETEKVIAVNNAINTFNRDITNGIALNIAQHESPVIPDGILRFYIQKVYDEFQDSELKLFIKHYEWAIDYTPEPIHEEEGKESESVFVDHNNVDWNHKEEMFIKNIYRFSGRDLVEMVIYAGLLMMQIDRFDMNSFAFSCLVNTAKQLNIDPEEIRTNAENQFGIDLSEKVDFITD